MRQLKHHEKKLLKRVDFLQWKNEDNHREIQVREAMRPATSCDSTIRTLAYAQQPVHNSATCDSDPEGSAGSAWQHRLKVLLTLCNSQPCAAAWSTAPHVCSMQIMRKYHIQDRDDYKKYNKIVGMITKLTSVLKHLDAKDPTRIELTEQLLAK